MKYQKILIVFAAIVLGLLVVVKVNAADYGAKKIDNVVNRFENKATRSAASATQRLERIKKEADLLIEKRIASLNKLLERISSENKLSDAEKVSLKTAIQTNIDGLNALKVKIDADTDVDTTKADAKTIITNYYIYRMFDPKIRLLFAVNNLQTLATNLGTNATSIQNLINTLKSQGKDVAIIQSLLDDVNLQLSTINTALANDKTKLEGITTTSDFSTVLSQVRQDLQNVRINFQKIRNDISQMRTDFRGILKTSTSPTP